jgi:hypothetical protein
MPQLTDFTQKRELMNDVRLTDFTERTLAALGIAVKHEIETFENQIEIVSGFQSSELKNEYLKECHDTLEDLNLVRVQIMNATIQVKMMEQVKNN